MGHEDAGPATSTHYVGQCVSRVRWLQHNQDLLAVGTWDSANARLHVLAGTSSQSEDISSVASAKHPGDVNDMLCVSSAVASRPGIVTAAGDGSVQHYALQHPAGQATPSLVPAWSYRPDSSGAVSSVDVHAASGQLACVTDAGAVGVVAFGATDGANTARASESGAQINCVRYLGASRIATCSTALHTHVWDTRQLDQPMLTLKDSESRALLHTLAMHPSQPEIVVTGSSDGVLSVWDLRNPRWPLSRTSAHQDLDIWEVAFHPAQPDFLVSCGDDGAVLLWDFNPARDPSRLSFHAPSNSIDDLRLTSLIDMPDMPINSVAIDADTNRLVSGGDAGSVTIERALLLS